MEAVVDNSWNIFSSTERKTEGEDDTTTGIEKSACGGRQSVVGLEKQSIFCGNKSSITTDLRRAQIFCDLSAEKCGSVNMKGVKPTEVVAHKEFGNELF